MLEKAKGHSKKGNHVAPGKKANNLTNHYRSMVTSQMTTTGNQFSTNERPVIATKLKPGPKGQMAPVDRRDGRFHLPNVRSNEGKLNLDKITSYESVYDHKPMYYM